MCITYVCTQLEPNLVERAMSPKRLTKYFPELAHLPAEEQEAVLARAQKNIENNRHTLRVLADNLLRATILFGICLLFIWYLRPALGMSDQTTAIVIMALVIPTYLVIQQRRYLQKIRSELQKDRA